MDSNEETCREVMLVNVCFECPGAYQLRASGEDHVLLPECVDNRLIGFIDHSRLKLVKT